MKKVKDKGVSYGKTMKPKDSQHKQKKRQHMLSHRKNG